MEEIKIDTNVEVGDIDDRDYSSSLSGYQKVPINMMPSGPLHEALVKQVKLMRASGCELKDVLDFITDEWSARSSRNYSLGHDECIVSGYDMVDEFDEEDEDDVVY